VIPEEESVKRWSPSALVAVGALVAAHLALQVTFAPPAHACHGIVIEVPTLVPGGFTVETRATTLGLGNTGWDFNVTSITPNDRVPTVTWTRIDAYPGGDPVGEADPTSHGSGEAMRFTVGGLSAGDEITLEVFTFTGTNGDCTGALTSRLSRTVTVTIAQDATPPAPVPDPTPLPPTLVCSPGPYQVGTVVTCTVSDAPPEIDILWNATAGGFTAGRGVTTDADGRATFSFVISARGGGAELDVELVEWLQPLVLGPVGAPVTSIDGALMPTAVSAGEGIGAPLRASVTGTLVTVLLAIALLGRTRRRMPTGAPATA
jgi:hypothetical protein